MMLIWSFPAFADTRIVIKLLPNQSIWLALALAVIDEILHLRPGVTAWQTGNYRRHVTV